jgi:sigma-B regulation protein RsbU (phosphoserine phosphatase)
MPTPAPRTGLRTSASTAADLARLHLVALPHPDSVPEPFELACWSRPLETIGGDLLVAWPAGRDRLLLFLADVMGHDLMSAMVASAIRLDLYRAREAGMSSPAAVLQRLDQAIGALFQAHFVTAACCLLDARRRTLTWSLAGHYPILLREPRGLVCPLHHRAYALGMNPGECYRDEVARLAPGASVVLYSDGISEPLGSPDVLAGLVACQDATADETVRAIREAVRSFRRTDDRSVLAARVRAA